MLDKEEKNTQEETPTTEIDHGAPLPWKERRSLIVWVYTLRPIRQLRKYGLINHVSKKMKYVIIYMDDVDSEKNKEALEKLHFVRKVEPSFRPDVATEFSKIDLQDDGFEVEELGTTIKLAEKV